MTWKVINSTVARALKSRLAKILAKVLNTIFKAHLRKREEEVSISPTLRHWSYHWCYRFGFPQVIKVLIYTSIPQITFYGLKFMAFWNDFCLPGL